MTKMFDNNYFKKIFTRLPQERQEIASTRLTLLKQHKPRIKTILDVGCGYGDFLAVCYQSGIKTYGTDISATALKYTEIAVPGVTRQKADVSFQKLSFKSDLFDAVCCFDVVEHLRKTDLLFSEVLRVLKKDGVFFLITPPITLIGNIINHFIADDPTHINRQPIKFWENELTRHGFKITAGKYALLFGFPPTIKLRQFFRTIGLTPVVKPFFSPVKSITAVLYLFAQKA